MQNTNSFHELYHPLLKLPRLAEKKSLDYELDLSIPWLQELYHELNSEQQGDPQPDDLWLKLVLHKSLEKLFGNVLTIEAEFESSYHDHCVRCLRPTECHLQFSFNACFLPHHLEQQEEYKDQAVFFHRGQEWDLYFHQKNLVNLQELLHEHIFLNKLPHPLHSPDCKGLCQKCGADLNQESCSHLA